MARITGFTLMDSKVAAVAKNDGVAVFTLAVIADIASRVLGRQVFRGLGNVLRLLSQCPKNYGQRPVSSLPYSYSIVL